MDMPAWLAALWVFWLTRGISVVENVWELVQADMGLRHD